MDILDLKVYKSPFNKVRLGRDCDGGYIMNDIPDIKYKMFLSGGIGDDISFENDFHKLHPDVDSYIFDGTIDKLPIDIPKFKFIKKNIGYYNDEGLTNLQEYIDSVDDGIFIKMDIEGGEVDWIKSLKKEHLEKMEQIIMEFHTPYSIREKDIFAKLNETHYIVHFHENNHCIQRIYQGIIIPDVFELTYLNKKYFNSPPEKNNESFPLSIDMKNNPYSPINTLYNYPPFCYNSA
jgi:hypothetical protein